MATQFIYFDCMDTLIQMDIPSLEVYCQWAYQGAEALGLWQDPASFERDWTLHRDQLQAACDHREGTILGRLRDLLRQRVLQAGLPWVPGKIEEEALRIHRLYWQRYRASTFVLPEVHRTLERIQREKMLPLGVVSNFMVEGGIPALLSDHGLDRFFQVVLVSCDQGFRKPSEVIYRLAIQAAGVAPEEILFVGDHPLTDYHGPRAMGMRSLLYDRLGQYPEIPDRVESFQEIERWVGD